MRRIAGPKRRRRAQEPDWRHALAQQGRIALESMEPESWERNALHWSARKLRSVRNAARGILVGIGLFWICLGLFIASLYFPQVRLFLLFLTAAAAVLVGMWFVSLGIRLGIGFSRRIGYVEDLAEMSNVERHAHVVRKVRRRSPPNGRARQ